jgi:hypothetical protein
MTGPGSEVPMRWWVAAAVLLGVGALLAVGSVAYELAVDGFPFPPQDARLVTPEQWQELYPSNPAAVGMRLAGVALFAAGVMIGGLAWLQWRAKT